MGRGEGGRERGGRKKKSREGAQGGEKAGNGVRESKCRVSPFDLALHECHPAAGFRPFIIPCMEYVAYARGILHWTRERNTRHFGLHVAG